MKKQGKQRKPKLDVAVRESIGRKGKPRFLDFNISTTSVNSGSQQYGAGLSLKGDSGGNSKGGQKSGLKSDTKLRAVRGGATARYGGDQPGLFVPETPESEMIGRVIVPDSSYNVTNDFAVQPAMSVEQGSCFKFIVPFARLYEKYHIKELEFEYRPLVSGYDEGGKAGQVILVYSYNALSGPPVDTVAALQSNPHVSGMANSSMRLRVDPRLAMDGGKYTRDSAVGMADIKTYDAGRLFVVVEGIPVTGREVGQIIVRYKIGFINPRPESIVSAPPNMVFNTYYKSETGTVSNGTVPTGMPIAQYDLLTVENPLSIELTPGPGVGYGGTPGFKLPKGCYLIAITGVFWNSSLLTFGIGCHIWSSGNAGGSWGPLNGVASTAFSNQSLLGAATSLTYVFHVGDDAYRICPAFQCWGNAAASNGTYNVGVRFVKLS